jgi:hypothetical protein
MICFGEDLSLWLLGDSKPKMRIISGARWGATEWEPVQKPRLQGSQAGDP